MDVITENASMDENDETCDIRDRDDYCQPFYLSLLYVLEFVQKNVRLVLTCIWKVRLERPGIDAIKFKVPT